MSSSNSTTSTVQKDSSLDSQESNNQDKTQLSLTRCNSVDSKAHLVLNVCKTAQVKYNTIPALKVNTTGTNTTTSSSHTSNNKSSTSSPSTSPPCSSCPAPNCSCSSANNNSNHLTNLRIHIDSEGGILNTAFIDNAPSLCPIHRSVSPRQNHHKGPPPKSQSTTTNNGNNPVVTSHCNDVQLRRHSAYAKVYVSGDCINDNKCNLNQQPTNQRPVSFVQTIVTNNGHVTSVHQQHQKQLQYSQHQQKQQHQTTSQNIKEIDNGKTSHKRCWLKTKK